MAPGKEVVMYMEFIISTTIKHFIKSRKAIIGTNNRFIKKAKSNTV